MIQPSHQPEHHSEPQLPSDDAVAARMNGHGLPLETGAQPSLERQLLCRNIFDEVEDYLSSRVDELLEQDLNAARKVHNHVQYLTYQVSARAFALLSRMPAEQREAQLKTVVVKVADDQMSRLLSSNSAA